jgi:alkylation response protein AidB-like acyl-CoA dehydrogenase
MIGTIAPTIQRGGSEFSHATYLRSLYCTDLIASQLLSEPGFGSDLASVSSRAYSVRGGWEITGQKVWTLAARCTDVDEIPFRTNPDAPKREGLTSVRASMRYLSTVHSYPTHIYTGPSTEVGVWP